MKLDDLLKKPVVSMKDGRKIGEVDDLVLDTATWTISDLYVKGEPGRGLIRFGSLKGIGPDAVTIEQADGIAYNVKTEGLSYDDLKGMHVVDGTGTVRGHVAAITFEGNGAIESLEVRQGGVFGIGAHVVNVTPREIRGRGGQDPYRGPSRRGLDDSTHEPSRRDPGAPGAEDDRAPSNP